MAMAEPLTPTTPTWTLGERLAKARKDAGLDQAEMAAKLKVSRAAVSLWEQDRSQPRDYMGTMRLWALTTNVPVSWLLALDSSSGYKKDGTPLESPNLKGLPSHPKPRLSRPKSPLVATVATV